MHTPTALQLGFQKDGKGYFQTHSVRSPRAGLYLYKGRFLSFHCTDRQKLKNIPCTIAFRGKGYPLGNFDYFLEGTLSKKSDRFYSFKLKKKSSWIQAKKRASFTSFRYEQKKKLKKFFSKNITHNLSHSLITSLATGEVDHPFLRFSFARLGLSHLLAISGFHFALVVTFISFFLKKIFSQKIFLITLSCLASIYFLFLGMSPSVFRAWSLVMFYILAALLGKKAKPMNLIGCCLLINLTFAPQDAFHLGFQLSYLSYLAIILLYPPIHRFFLKIINNRSIESFSISHKMAYHILRYFRTAIGINLAVHLLIFPVLIYHFSKFPFYSLIYNLFIPLSVSLLLYLCLIAFFIPYLFPLVEYFSKYLLRVIMYPPTIFEYTIHYKNLSLNFMLFYVILLFLLTIAITSKRIHYPQNLYDS